MDVEEPPLAADVRELLGASDPWGLLELTSALTASVDAEDPDPFARATPRPEPGGADLGDLVRSFLELDTVEFTALLTAVAELVPDELLARRIVRELRTRTHRLPRWLTALQPLDVVPVAELTHVLGDGDNVALGLRTALGDQATLVVYVDHNLGTLVKDAFLTGVAPDVVADRFLAASDEDPDLSLTAPATADVRARLTEAVDAGRLAHPPVRTETWPASRPLLEWALRHLPEGGHGYPRHELSPGDQLDLLHGFLGSREGRDHDHDEGAELAGALLAVGAAHGNRDPLRWSAVAVEMALADWLPRRLRRPTAASPDTAEVFADLVRYGHRRRGIRDELTEETLAAIAATVRELQHRPPDADELLMPVGYRDLMLELLEETVGGRQALLDMGTGSLPDEELDTTSAATDIVPVLREVSGLADDACEQLLDREHRTACRRLLADVATADPGIFRRRGRPETAAAAVVWIVASANDSFDPHVHGGLSATRLSRWFGIAGGPSSRADTLLRALGVDRSRNGDSGVRLGTPRYLVSSQRQAVRERWSRLLET